MLYNNLCKLCLLVVLVLAIMQIINYFNYKPEIIETKEHMNAALLTHQIEDLQKVPTEDSIIKFYNKDELNKPTQQFNLIDPLLLGSTVPCGPSMDWSVNIEPGLNNKYSDVLWHTTDPKMLIESNCVNCSRN